MDLKDKLGILRVSVRNLVEFVMQSGDIGTQFYSPARMVDAIKAHQAVQNQRGEGYLPEVPVTYAVEHDGYVLEISGRIDGVIIKADTVIIDEIKTTYASLDDIDGDYNPLHFAQAKCYAYIYACQNNLYSIGVQITYYQMETCETKTILKQYNFIDLKNFFDGLVAKYLQWENMIRNWKSIRDSSIHSIQFPFSSYRKGQRELAISVYKTVRDGGKLFVQAPTGIGKTISVLFPAIKALGEGLTSKIFYLTARTTTRAAAESAVDIMRNNGLKIKSLTITAKEKVCFCPGTRCHFDYCRYAKGYYDRVMDAVKEIFRKDSFTLQNIQEYAQKHSICPFEFSLDLALWSDFIICDYNYAFDPRVYLKRFFKEDNGDYCFLIDEAHNLVDRSREMFSATLHKKPILDLKHAARSIDRDLWKCLKEINDFMVRLRKECSNENVSYAGNSAGYIVKSEMENEIYPLLRKFIKISEACLSGMKQSEFHSILLETYFEVGAFLRISEYYDEKYVTCIEKSGNDVSIRVFCVDPSRVMSDALKRAKCSVLFSATLRPMDYFIRTFGGDEHCRKMILPSPYPTENLCLMIDNSTATKYRAREFSYDKVAELIAAAVGGKRGNYLAYFSSYKYMKEVYIRFYAKNPNIQCVCQKPNMSDSEREEFLYLFSPSSDETFVGFAVMGGVFGEGIDLAGERLSGAIIVGVGLPQVCMEREIICRYFNENCGMGFEFAYIYPGINKVLQAAGRVIRSENDRGVVLLIDERFTNYSYRELLPGEWKPHIVGSADEIIHIVDEFWSS